MAEHQVSDLQLSDHEREVLNNLENACYLRDMTTTRGWKLFLEIKDKRIEQVTKQFLKAKLDKDALWAAQIRLNGIVEFLDVLFSGVQTAVDSVDPATIQKVVDELITPYPPDAYDGEIDLKEL